MTDLGPAVTTERTAPVDLSTTWTIVTVTFNSHDVLATFWRLRSNDDARWIVVDNASTDATPELAEALGAEVIRLPRNVGFSSANNVGLAHATTPYIAFVNPDVDIAETSFPMLERSLDRQDGLVSPQLLNADGTPQPNGRGYPTVWAKLGHRILRASRSSDSYRIFSHAGEEVTVCWLMGAFVSGRTATFRRLQGWNSSYFLYYEDSEIGLRAAKSGIASRLVGSTTARHGWARETTAFRWRPWVNEIRSAARFYLTNTRMLMPLRWVAHREEPVDVN